MDVIKNFIVSFVRFKVNDLVLLCYDEQRSNYMVLTSEDTKYFLHPDSKSALKLSTGMLETFAQI